MKSLQISTNGYNNIFRKCITEVLRGFSPFNEYRVIVEVYGDRNIAEVKYKNLSENEYKELQTRFYFGVDAAKSLYGGSINEKI